MVRTHINQRGLKTMATTILHNPRCSKSRQTLDLLHQHDIKPEIIEYLKTPLTIDQLKTIYEQLNISSLREMIRTKESEYTQQNLNNASDEQLYAAMATTPKLIERPIVTTNKGARIGRPPENILEIIE